MFRTYQTLLNRLLQVIDALIVLLSFLIAWYVKFVSGWLHYQDHLPFRTYFFTVLFSVPVFLVVNWFVGLYKPMRIKPVASEALRVLWGSIGSIILLMSALYFVKLVEFSRDLLVIFWITNILLALLTRTILRFILHIMRDRGLNQKFILVVGWSKAAERFIDVLYQHPWFGYRILGLLSDDQPILSDGSPLHHLGRIYDIESVLRENVIDHVIIALPRDGLDQMKGVLVACEQAGVQSLIIPDYFDLLPARPRFETIGDMPLIDTRYVPLDDAMNAFTKRVFDIVFSTTILITLAPIMVLIAVAIKLTSEGPVVYSQSRVGRNRRVFTMHKFRTMRHEIEDTPFWTTQNDQRRTSIGTFLRRTSLDELPQFWNVFIGDMSVVGPRPEQPSFVDQFKDRIPKYMVKHRVRPGITGWAQVNGWRGDTSIDTRIRYDIEYIENWSFWLDVKIALKTLLSGFVHPNAY